MLTVDPLCDRRFVLDLLLLVLLDVVRRYNVAKLAGMQRSCPIWRIVMLEFERFVEHTPYASNAYWATVDVGAGVI